MFENNDMKYYFIQVLSQMDRYEYCQSMVTTDNRELTFDEAEDIALQWLGHEDSGEKFKVWKLHQITKEEFEILSKYL